MSIGDFDDQENLNIYMFVCCLLLLEYIYVCLLLVCCLGNFITLLLCFVCHSLVEFKSQLHAY